MNPLFQAMTGGRTNQAIDMLRAIKNPQQAFQSMMMNNPQFRKFMEQNKGKTPQQVAQEHGIDINQLKNMM